MTYLLLIQMMMFSPMGGVIKTSTLEMHYESKAQCDAALQRRMDEWQRAYASSMHVGIIARCVEPAARKK